MSFRLEYDALWKWFEAEGEKLEAAHTPRPGFDDTLMYERRPIIQEYDRRLAALKEKYGHD